MLSFSFGLFYPCLNMAFYFGFFKNSYIFLTLYLCAISQVILSMKQADGVPRGLLRFIVLKFLADKPMSGTEIVGKIRQETGGKWTPSPGSIYPLLSGLEGQGFTHEVSPVEGGMKRYFLTENGQEFFKNQVSLGQNFMEKMEYLAPMFIGGFHFGINDENLLCAKESAKRVLQTFIELDAQKETLTKENVNEIARILDNSNTQLRKIIEDINRENQPRISK
jgi:DNA-binding PadR family transcriptional regulator